jgi:hypothetical protein
VEAKFCISTLFVGKSFSLLGVKSLLIVMFLGAKIAHNHIFKAILFAN